MNNIELRDYFAGLALPSILNICTGDTQIGESYEDYCAQQAYKVADAMLKARKVKNETDA